MKQGNGTVDAMRGEALPQCEFVLYQTEDGRTRIQCRFEEETIWLKQVQIAELFLTTVPNINQHLKAVYAERELDEAATVRSHLVVRSEGVRQVSRKVLHHNLPATLAVGYRGKRGRSAPIPADAEDSRALKDFGDEAKQHEHRELK